MAQLSRWFSLITVSKCSPTTPGQHAALVWAIPFSLATTQGITIVFFSSRLLRCFSSGGWLSFRVIHLQCIRLSHSEIFGYICLCAAPRSLSQLTTSFIASQTQGIHHTPLIALKILNVIMSELSLHICYSLITTYLFPNMSKNLINLANQLMCKYANE